MLGAQLNDSTTLLNDIHSSHSGGEFVATASASTGVNHDIILEAKQLSNGLLAYKMVKHIKNVEGGKSIDLTKNYSAKPTIPGPTIVISEGDTVDLQIKNGIGSGMVSVHVHGVHYEITSDGTLSHLNGVGDQGATNGSPFTVHWTAGPGTAGTWPYHDHTFGGINGAENRGLFGTVIVNPASGKVQAADGNQINEVNVSKIKKDFVLYVGDDAFWGMEINSNGKQTALWTNPTLGTETGEYVRFHLIALGTDAVHTFKLNSYKWLDPGTDALISSKDIGPLENHVFTIKAKKGNVKYLDENISNELMGMIGSFKVPGQSKASPIPEPF
jgi:FtsP/CotA-like multicopper oxidase with cupredoxin domain